MWVFHVLPGIKPSDSFLPNNGCFYKSLPVPGKVPHNASLSFPFVSAGRPYGLSLVDFYLMFTGSVV